MVQHSLIRFGVTLCYNFSISMTKHVDRLLSSVRCLYSLQQSKLIGVYRQGGSAKADSLPPRIQG